MARREDFRIRATLEAKDNASGTIGRVENRWASFGNTLKSKLAVGLKAATAGLAAFTALLVRSVGLANVQEKAVNDLASALSKYGEEGTKATESAIKFAEALQRQSTFGDEAIIQAQALLVQLGAAPETLNAATQATVELAAAFGKSLPEAARLVGRTFGGFAGELGEIIPSLRGLSQEALQSGEAVNLLIQQFGGSAAAQTATFSGQIQQLSNVFGDLLEKLGESVTQNPKVLAAIDDIKRTLTDPQFLQDLQALAGYIAQVISALVEFAQASVREIKAVIDIFNNATAAIREFFGVIEEQTPKAKNFELQIQGAGNAVQQLGLTLGASIDKFGTVSQAANNAGKETEELGNANDAAADSVGGLTIALDAQGNALIGNADGWNAAAQAVAAYSDQVRAAAAAAREARPELATFNEFTSVGGEANARAFAQSIFQYDEEGNIIGARSVNRFRGTASGPFRTIPFYVDADGNRVITGANIDNFLPVGGFRT